MTKNDDDVLDLSEKKPADKSAEKPAANATDKKAGKPAAEKKADATPATPLKIEADVPMPENTSGRKSSLNLDRMPFAALEVGQSFADPLTKGRTGDGITVKTVMTQVRKNWPDRTYIVREAVENGVEVARFWRKK